MEHKNKIIQPDWISQSKLASTMEQEDKIITSILAADKQYLPALRDMATATGCVSLIRCAALDQVTHLIGPSAIRLLVSLTNPEKEIDDKLRKVAFQWLFSIYDQLGKDPIALIRRGISDPNPTINWWASIKQ